MLTGTSFGVGMARNPAIDLRDGDTVRVAVCCIEAVENRIEVAL
jgi:2-keto-4-pentenoate hydratase/2-oxohepta-3-ene-1,7-dioic acid hydratase in catechol pathway